ncbi:MAG: hypothetical protein QOI28_79 [Mycobacterium sp.]|jgi:hypothetical protein|nr:hypothetical protein [Mycobacterium sp.]
MAFLGYGVMTMKQAVNLGDPDSGSTGLVPSEAQVSAAFDYAGLTISLDRLAANYEVYASRLALIRKASTPGLGETAPAVGFKASWD